MVSELGLIRLPLSHKKDARLNWVNTVYIRGVVIQIKGQHTINEYIENVTGRGLKSRRNLKSLVNCSLYFLRHGKNNLYIADNVSDKTHFKITKQKNCSSVLLYEITIINL